MTMKQWESLMKAWSAQLVTTDLVKHLDERDRTLKYLGFPPAGKKEIATLERRLKVALPPSYRSFLEATDGFRVISPFTYRLRPVVEVDWFRVENQGWIETYNEPSIYDDPDRREPTDVEYFDYRNAGEHGFRDAHLWEMLQVSDDGDGVMLLNPMAVTPDGEWEAWFFANWIPGAHRYASFAHMMVETYQSLRKMKRLPTRPKLPVLKTPGPKIPRHSVVETQTVAEPMRALPKRRKGEPELKFMARFLAAESVEKVTPAPPELVKLLDDLQSAKGKALAKVIRILEGKQKVRAMSSRHPELVARVAELARTLPDSQARAACVGLLTNITPDGAVPDWLVAALNDPDLAVQGRGLYAIFFFKGRELVRPVIRILAAAKDMFSAQSAATALSELADSEAIPALADALERSYPSEIPAPPEILNRLREQHYGFVAVALAKFGPPVVEKFKTLLLHTDPNRRIAAIIGLRAIGDPAMRALVAELKEDPHPGVRLQAEMCDRVWGLS